MEKKIYLLLVCANKSSGQIEAQKSTYVRRILGKISQGKVEKFIKKTIRFYELNDCDHGPLEPNQCDLFVDYLDENRDKFCDYIVNEKVGTIEGIAVTAENGFWAINIVIALDHSMWKSRSKSARPSYVETVT